MLADLPSALREIDKRRVQIGSCVSEEFTRSQISELQCLARQASTILEAVATAPINDPMTAAMYLELALERLEDECPDSALLRRIGQNVVAYLRSRARAA